MFPTSYLPSRDKLFSQTVSQNESICQVLSDSGEQNTWYSPLGNFVTFIEELTPEHLRVSLNLPFKVYGDLARQSLSHLIDLSQVRLPC